MRTSILGTEMPNEGLATLTRQLVNAIDSRKSFVTQRYRRESIRDHRLLEVFKIFDRKAF
jgi:hypothetical protein